MSHRPSFRWAAAGPAAIVPNPTARAMHVAQRRFILTSLWSLNCGTAGSYASATGTRLGRVRADRLLPAEETHREEEGGKRPGAHHGRRARGVAGAANDPLRQAVDQVLERQHLGHDLERARQVVRRVEDARDEDHGEKYGVGVGGGGVLVRD